MSDMPQFPQLPKTPAELPAQPVNFPQGIPFVDSKYHKPLYKMLGKMMNKKAPKLGKTNKLRSGLKKAKKVKIV